MQEQFSVAVGERCIYPKVDIIKTQGLEDSLVYLSALSPPHFLKKSFQRLTSYSQSLLALLLKAEAGIFPKWNESKIKMESGCFFLKRQDGLGSKEG